MKKTHCADGTISAYGFACGRTMDFENGHRSVHLWYQHGVYFIRDIDVFHLKQETRRTTSCVEAKRIFRFWKKLANFA